jgi:hypothetical protein
MQKTSKIDELCVIKNAFKFWSKQKIRSEQEGSERNAYVPIIINDDILNSRVEFIASAPPDRNMSFSASGLPFPSMEAALSVTPNIGIIEGVSRNKEFKLPLFYPNTFYIASSHKVMPTVFIRYKTAQLPESMKYLAIKIGNGIPFRSLFPEKQSWQHDEYVTTQEKILLRNAYPSHIP